MTKPYWFIAVLAACSSTPPAHRGRGGDERGRAESRQTASTLAEAQRARARLRAAAPSSCTRDDPRTGSALLETRFPTTRGAETQLVSPGRPALVAFWAGWCEPCRQELPHYIQLRDELGDWGVELVLASVDTELGAVVRGLVALGLDDETSLYAADGFLRQFFQSAMPWTIVVDHDGIIRASQSGFDERCLAWLMSEAKVAGLEAKAGAT